MPGESAQISAKIVKNFKWRFFLLRKSMVRSFYRYNGYTAILFIVGCQRSGTSLMQRIFERDLRAKVYGEFSKLTSCGYDKIRLNPLPHVKKELDKDRVPIVVLKPLVETQNSTELLGFFENAKALWLYRNYKDVASSNLRRFGLSNGIKDLRFIIENVQGDWRHEKLSKKVKNIISEHFAEDMNPYDAAALFWYARNSYFFDLGFSEHDNIRMCKYEELVREPAAMLRGIYNFVSVPFPGDRIVAEVRTSPVGKGSAIALSPEIESICSELLHEMDEVYQSRRVSSV